MALTPSAPRQSSPSKLSLSAVRRVQACAAVSLLSPSMSATLAQQKIRIRLKAFDRRMLDLSCDKIIETADHTAATAIGPIPLPTKRKIYCVLRSPHVDKDSREHFETRTHRRIIDIYSPSAKTIDALMKLDLPSGVDIEVKL